MLATLIRYSAWNTSHWPRKWCRKIPSAWIMRHFAQCSRSMSSGASQSGIMREGEHMKPSSHLAWKVKPQIAIFSTS